MRSSGVAREHDKQLHRRPGPSAAPRRSFQRLRPRAPAPAPPSAPPSTLEEEVPPEKVPRPPRPRGGGFPRRQDPSVSALLQNRASPVFNHLPDPSSALPGLAGPGGAPAPRPKCLPHFLGFREDRVPQLASGSGQTRPSDPLTPRTLCSPPAKPQRVWVLRALHARPQQAGPSRRAGRRGRAPHACSRKWPAGLGWARGAGGGGRGGPASRGQSQLLGTGVKEVEPPSTSSGPRHPLRQHQPALTPRRAGVSGFPLRRWGREGRSRPRGARALEHAAAGEIPWRRRASPPDPSIEHPGGCRPLPSSGVR